MRATGIFIGMVLTLANVPVNGRTIRAGVGAEIKTIRDAITAALDGDTVLISPGVYREGNLIIEKSISIIGVDMPTLDGENKFEILTIHANGVKISGLRFINTGVASISDIAAIKILDSKNVSVVGNQLRDTFFGIYMANTSFSRIEGNEVVSSVPNEFRKANGIHLWKCHDIKIKGNRVNGHRDGIYFEFVTDSEIADNISEANMRYGLHFMFSHNDEYRANRFSKNGAGVAVMYSHHVKMVGNRFLDNWGSAAYGLLLKDIRDSHVTSNEFKGNSVGIFMEGSSRIEFESNEFYQNGYALRLQASCDGNNFSRNNFQANTFDLVTNGSLVLNTINGNYWDKYEGYDLDKNAIGDVPYRPVSLYGTIIEQVPPAMLLWRSFLVYMIDRAEKAIPAITPENLLDTQPKMRPYDLLR
jgi:nitrous oxidase accessory protein